MTSTGKSREFGLDGLLEEHTLLKEKYAAVLRAIDALAPLEEPEVDVITTWADEKAVAKLVRVPPPSSLQVGLDEVTGRAERAAAREKQMLAEGYIRVADGTLRKPPSWDPLGVCPDLWEELPDLPAVTSPPGLVATRRDRLVTALRSPVSSSWVSPVVTVSALLGVVLVALAPLSGWSYLFAAALIVVLAFSMLGSCVPSRRPTACRMCCRALVRPELKLGVCSYCARGDANPPPVTKLKQPFCATCTDKLSSFERKHKLKQCRPCLREGLVIPKLVERGFDSHVRVNRSRARDLDRRYPLGLIETHLEARSRTKLVCSACHQFKTAEGTRSLSCKPCLSSGAVIPMWIF